MIGKMKQSEIKKYKNIDSDNFSIMSLDRIWEWTLPLYTYSPSIQPLNKEINLFTESQPIFSLNDKTILYAFYLPSLDIKMLEIQRKFINKFVDESILYLFSGCPCSLFKVDNVDIQKGDNPNPNTNIRGKYLYVKFKEIWNNDEVGKF